jgi:hypothetical protein
LSGDIDLEWVLSQILPDRGANGGNTGVNSAQHRGIPDSILPENAVEPLTAPAGHAKSSIK